MMLNDNIFIGIVENNTDPINQGRVQVRWFDIHPAYNTGLVLTDDLPWAMLLNGTGGKFFSVPDNGDWVVGSFFDGREAQHPFIYGTINTTKNSLPALPSNSSSGNNSVSNLSSTDPFVGNDRAAQAYEYFISKGLTPEQAAGIVGNLQQESGENLNTAAYNPGENAQGIGQWRGSRLDAFKDRYGVSPLESSFEDQLDFIMYEFNTTESSAYSKLKATTSVSEAAAVFDSTYERSSGATLKQRVQNAQNILNFAQKPDTNIVDGTENPFLAPTSDIVNNFGNNAIPPQMSGENIHLTPISLQYLNQNANEGDIPISGSIKSSVWQARQNGSFIEMNGSEQEFINIVHQSGAFVTIDPNGNIIIKSVGNLGQFAQGSVFQAVEGSINIEAGEGLNIKITNGAINIESEADLNLTSHSNINISAAGKINLNSGESTNISAGKVGITSRLEDIDIHSGRNMLITSATEINLKAVADINVDGSKIYMSSNLAKTAAVAEGLKSISKSIGSRPPVHSTPPAIGGGMIDDGSELI